MRILPSAGISEIDVEAAIAFGAKNQLNNESITATGSVIVATGDGKTVRVEIPRTATTGKSAGTWTFDVQATLSPSGRKVTLVSGTLTLRASKL